MKTTLEIGNKYMKKKVHYNIKFYVIYSILATKYIKNKKRTKECRCLGYHKEGPLANPISTWKGKRIMVNVYLSIGGP